jgi:hypothetical protein
VKSTYVKVVRAMRATLGAVGVLALLDAWSRSSRTGRWVRSLLAIYDLRELVALDTPWWTFAASDLVDQHLSRTSGARVFEWGSGASTAWLSQRAAHVVAVEHDPDWADHVRLLVGETAQVLTVPPVVAEGGTGIRSHKSGYAGLDFTDYVEAIAEHKGTFDLIVIDGRAREACLRLGLPRLAPGGLIVFDNVERKRYRVAIAAEPGLEVLWTSGLTPSLPYPTRTALIRHSSSP